MALLRDALEKKLGGSLSGLSATAENVQKWNAEVAEGLISSFDYRVLTGIALGNDRPAHGEVAAYDEKLGKRLDQSRSWITKTISVARELRLAFEEDVPVPEEIRQTPWMLVPAAIANVRAGRALNDFPKKAKEGESEASVGKQMRGVIRSLGRVEEREAQARALRSSVDQLLKFAKKHDIAVPRCQLPGIDETPTTRTVADVPDVTAAPDPVDGEPDRPGRRPRGTRGGGRRGRPSGVRDDNDR